MKIKKPPISNGFWRIISLFPGSGEASRKKARSCSDIPLMEELEPRLLFSADSIVVLPDNQDAIFQPFDSGPAESQLIQTENSYQSSASQSSRYEIVFIDAGVDDYQQLLNDLLSQQDSGRRFDIYVLDNDRDGIEQISETLNGQQDVDAIHILSHGDSGRINLGNSWLDINTLDQYSDAIASWNQVLGEEADLLIYGCNLAASETGQALTQSLSDLTGADVAASDDLTGQAIFGGDWDLEYFTGDIETNIAFSQQLQQDWRQLLNVSIDTTSTGTTPTAGASGTVSHTTTGTGRLMLVGISFGQDKGDSVSSITYNGVNLSFVGAQDNSIVLGSRVEIWQLVAPDTGTHDVVVNYSGTSHIGAAFGATTFTGVDQSTPLGTFASSEGESSTPSTTITSSSGALVFGVLAADHNADIDLVPGSGQTEHWDLFQDKATGSGSTEAGAASVNTSWTLPLIRKWAAAGVSINPSDEAPVADAGGPYSINEGDSLNLDASSSFDPDTDPLTYEWDLSYDNSTFNPESTGEAPTLSWATLQGMGVDDNGTYTIAVRAIDGQGNTSIAQTTLTVSNTPPILTVTGAATANDGGLYTLNLDASDPGDDTITSWTINWGDGTIETIPGDPSAVTHTYTNAGFTNNITVSATDEDNPDNYIHNDLFAGHYAIDAGVYRAQGDWGNPLVEFANEGTLDKTIQPIIGPDGFLYVSGESSNNVLRYHADTGILFDVFVSQAAGGISSAGGLTFGPNGNLFVADYGTGSIKEYDAITGTFIGNFVSSGSSTMDQPYSLVFGPDGDLYVGSYNQNTVYRFDGNTGAPVNNGGPDPAGTFIPTAQNGGLGTAEQILFGPDGNLYVADLTNDRVLRFDGTTGVFIDIFVVANANGLEAPNGLAFGPDGLLYVTDSKNGVLLRYDGSDGSIIASLTDPYVTGLDKPSHIAFAPDLQVTVNANNNAPVFEAVGPFTADENSAVTTAVGNIDANDGDGGVTDTGIIYSITSNVNPNLDGNDAFSIDSSSGEITVNDSGDLDFEGTTPLIITVQADDGANQSTTDVTINLNNINEAPASNDKTVSTNEDTDYLFSSTDFGFTDSGDTPANSLLGVKITTLPGTGTLYVDSNGDGIINIGEAVIAVDTIAVADITASRLKYRPVANDNGAGYSSFTFQVQDDGGTANGGVDLDQTPNTITIDVTAVNDAPVSDVVNISGNEATTSIAITLAGSDIDGTVDAFQLSSLPGNGTLYTDAGLTTAAVTGTDYTATTEALVLYFVPNSQWNGVTSFQFIAKDNSGLLDATLSTATITVSAVNDVPVAVTNTVSTMEGTAHIFLTSDFTFSDVEGDSLVSVTFSNLSLAGGTLEHSGSTPVTNGITLTAAQLTTLMFTPANNANGTPLASFDFTVNDADPGITVAQMSMNVTPVNDQLTATNLAQTMNYTEGAASVELDDIVVSDVDSGEMVTATLTLANPTYGGLTTSGGATYNAGTGDWNIISTLANVNAALANLAFIPTTDNEQNTSIAITIADGGENATVPVTGTIVLTVSPVNDAPAGADTTLTGMESTDYVFSLSDFGFTDTIDGDNFLAVEIVTLPTVSNDSLQINSVDVTAGQFINVADISAGNLVFSPPPGLNGLGFASFTFRVQDDGGTGNGGVNTDPIANTMTIDITAFNDPPVTSSLADVTVDEDAADTVIDLFAAFSDAEDALVYSMITNTNPGLFAATVINSVAGTLTLDYAPDLNGNTNITIRATDIGGQFIESTFSVTVNPLNDIPTTSGINNTNVNEDAPVSVIDLFAAFDDIETLDAALVYTLTNNTNPALFSSTTIDIGAGTLSLNYAPNQNGTADITVRATDTGGAFIETLFTVTVAAVNNAPTAISISNNQIQNTTDTSTGAAIGTLSAEDVDTSDTATYSIVGGTDADKFSIGGPENQLLILNDDVLDATLQASYHVVVRITDSGGLSHDESITVIVVQDTNIVDEFIAFVETTETVPVVSYDPLTEEPLAETVQYDTLDPLASPEPGYQIGNASMATAPPPETTKPEESPESTDEALPEKSKPDTNDSSDQTDKDALLINRELDTETRQVELIDKLIPNEGTLPTATEKITQSRNINDQFTYSTTHLYTLNDAVNMNSFVDAVNQLREESKDSALLQQKIISTSVLMSTGLSIGYIVWLVRGGILLSSILSSLPAWRFIDPMPILATLNDQEDDEDTETLESIIRDGKIKAEGKRNQILAQEKNIEK
ncbi:MAG: DUF4347 domain-containing protein [Gammaproteobacteria bacterium]